VKAQQDAFKTKGAISKSQRTSMIRENRREEANRTKQLEADPMPLTSPMPEISAQPTGSGPTIFGSFNVTRQV
jgi:hypothetical protein